MDLPGTTRTYDLMVRSHALYPAGLRADEPDKTFMLPQLWKTQTSRAPPGCQQQAKAPAAGAELSVKVLHTRLRYALYITPLMLSARARKLATVGLSPT